MADTKISALPASTTPLAGTELVPIVQSGVTKQVSVANLTAGRALNALSLTLTNAETYLGLSATAASGKLWYLISGGGGNVTAGYFSIWNGTGGNKVFSIAPSTSEQFTTDLSGNFNMLAGNVIMGTSGKGITDSTGTTKLGFISTGTQLTGTQQTSTGVFNNVGTAQNIAIPTGQAGHIVITGVQGGVGASSWTVPFVNRSGTTAVAASPSKAVVTADPISTVTASGANIVVTPLAANTYISYAIYYTPCAI